MYHLHSGSSSSEVSLACGENSNLKLASKMPRTTEAYNMSVKQVKFLQDLLGREAVTCRKLAENQFTIVNLLPADRQ